MKVDLPARPTGSLVPPLGQVSKQWLPLLSLLFLLALMMALANRFQPLAIDPQGVRPAEHPAPSTPVTKNPHRKAA